MPKVTHARKPVLLSLASLVLTGSIAVEALAASGAEPASELPSAMAGDAPLLWVLEEEGVGLCLEVRSSSGEVLDVACLAGERFLGLGVHGSVTLVTVDLATEEVLWRSLAWELDQATLVLAALEPTSVAPGRSSERSCKHALTAAISAGLNEPLEPISPAGCSVVGLVMLAVPTSPIIPIPIDAAVAPWCGGSSVESSPSKPIPPIPIGAAVAVRLRELDALRGTLAGPVDAGAVAAVIVFAGPAPALPPAESDGSEEGHGLAMLVGCRCIDGTRSKDGNSEAHCLLRTAEGQVHALRLDQLPAPGGVPQLPEPIDIFIPDGWSTASAGGGRSPDPRVVLVTGLPAPAFPIDIALAVFARPLGVSAETLRLPGFVPGPIPIDISVVADCSCARMQLEGTDPASVAIAVAVPARPLGASAEALKLAGFVPGPIPIDISVVADRSRARMQLEGTDPASVVIAVGVPPHIPIELSAVTDCTCLRVSSEGTGRASVVIPVGVHPEQPVRR